MATLTAYSSSGDGMVRNNGSGSWSTIQSAGTGTAAYPANNPTNFAYNDGTSADKYCDRGFFAFDLSSIPAGATIQSAVLSLYVTTKYSGAGGSMGLVAGTQASTSTLATSDYSACGSTEFCTRVNFSALTTSAYNDFTLNSSGVAHLQTNIAGYAKLCTRGSFDLDNSAPGTTVYSGAVGNYSEQSGTTNDPKLVVTYTTDKLTSDTWTWTDVAAPYRRSTVEVTVWAEGANTTLSGGQTLGSTVTVTDTSGFASSGTIWIYDGNNNYQQARATYTGKTATTFTGCTWTSVLGSLTYANGVGVSAPDAETHFPQVVALDDVATTSTPELVVTAKQGAGHGTLNGSLVMKRSTNGGLTWGSQTTIQTAVGAGLSPPRGIFGHTLLRLKNGRLLVMWYEHDLGYATTPGSTGPLYNYMSYSDDRGVTWSTPALMDLNFGFSNRDGYSAFSAMLYTGSGSNSTYGDVYVPITGNKDGITVHTSGEPYRWETWLYKITDGGASGSVTKVAEVFKYSDVAHAAGEGAIVIAANGDWIMQARIEPNNAAPDSGDQAKRNRWQSRSTDQGATWSTPVKVIDGFANGAVLHKLPEGVLLSTGSPVLSSRDSPNTGQTGTFLSGDNGTSWSSAAKWEATDATYDVYNGSDFQAIIDDSTVSRNTAFAYAQERSNQLGARTMFRWYVNPAAKSTSDSWAWTDSAARGALTWSRTTSDAWAWGDSGSVPVNAQRTTGDNLAWSDSATWAPVYLARTSSDAWAWADALARALVLGATAADAWIWTDSATRVGGALYYSRTTVDTWSWTDAIRASAATFYWFRTRRSDMSTPTKTYVQVLPKGTTRTSTYTSPTYRAETEAGILVVLDVTAASGTGGLTLRINAHDQASSQAIPLNAAPTAVTATETTSYALYPFGAIAGNVTQATSFYLPRMFSITVTHEDSSSYTYSVGYCLLP